LNLVLSFGDLSRLGGYRTRVLGELQTLDPLTAPDQFLLVFDRDPQQFEKTFDLNIPHLAIQRSAALLRFFPAIAQIARRKAIRLVHAHNLYSTALALCARKRYGYKVLLDYHGRVPEEYVYLGKGGSMSRRLLESLEAWCVKRSDHIIVVSERLANYLIERYQLPKQKISVVPCCSDGSMFTWNQNRRDEVRKSMNCADKFVCTHLGSFFEWYDPELLVEVFRQIAGQIDAHLLVVTNETDKATGYLSNHFPPDRFTVRSATHDQVPALLNASDLGLLLLRPSPNISTSSPVKFAEYLNCGLPVLMTGAVGDYSTIIVREGIGGIVGDDNLFDSKIIRNIQSQRTNLALHCQSIGRKLTWEAFAPNWLTMLSQM
jgi:glycosyltransferase involved in cell wall biosynthesis